MDRVEAIALLEGHLDELRKQTYEQLVDRLVDQEPITGEISGPTGASYQYEIQGLWDGGKGATGGNLRVIGSIDAGGLRAFRPLSSDFIIAPDGSFLGE